MGYFPFFAELKDKKGLIVGGGTVALRKIEKLLPFEPQLTVAAPDFLPQIEQRSDIICRKQPFSPDLLNDMFFVIAATDDTKLNHRISALCRERRLPVNVVDDPGACTFLFPALVKRGDLTVGICTSGDSPSAAIYLKNRINALLPENFEDLLSYLGDLRNDVKTAVPDEKLRSVCLSRLFAVCLAEGWPLAEDRLQTILQSTKEEMSDDSK